MSEEQAQEMDLADKAAAAVKEGETKAQEQTEALKKEAEKTQQELIELEALEKFKWNGRELTPEELDKAAMMQSDYTKKTQALAEERKFIDNLSVDIENVKNNPQLADQFRQIYPEKFHPLVDLALNTGSEEASDDLDDVDVESKTVKSLLSEIKELRNKIDGYDKRFRDENVQAAEVKIDAVFDKFGSRYELADEDAVINKAYRLIEDNRENPHFELTDARWEKLFKADHEARYEKLMSYEKARLEEQAKKGKEAADGGPGGTAPGRPRKRLNLDEAEQAMIEDLTR